MIAKSSFSIINVLLVLSLVEICTATQDYKESEADYSDYDSRSDSKQVEKVRKNLGIRKTTACPKMTAAHPKLMSAHPKTTTLRTTNVSNETVLQFESLEGEEKTSVYSEEWKTIKRNHGKSKGNSSEEEDEPTIHTHYPFTVSIQRKGSHYATGALVHKNWILSCAGEFYHTRESIKLLRVRLGSSDCKRRGIVVPLKQIKIHPLYVHGEPNYDLALLRMAKAVQFTEYIKPISLSKQKTGKVVSAKFMATYWPRLIVKNDVLPQSAEERTKSSSLRMSKQYLIAPNKCLELMKEQNISLVPTTMCLKNIATYHSGCLPDPGAPLVAENGLWGITSGWTSKDCKKAKPSPTMATRIALPSVLSWYNQQLMSESSSKKYGKKVS